MAQIFDLLISSNDEQYLSLAEAVQLSNQAAQTTGLNKGYILPENSLVIAFDFFSGGTRLYPASLPDPYCECRTYNPLYHVTDINVVEELRKAGFENPTKINIWVPDYENKILPISFAVNETGQHERYDLPFNKEPNYWWIKDRFGKYKVIDRNLETGSEYTELDTGKINCYPYEFIEPFEQIGAIVSYDGYPIVPEPVFPIGFFQDVINRFPKVANCARLDKGESWFGKDRWHDMQNQMFWGTSAVLSLRDTGAEKQDKEYRESVEELMLTMMEKGISPRTAIAATTGIYLEEE